MKRIYLIGLLAVLVLVAACGKQNKQETDNHGAHGGNSQAASSAGEHGAHGEEHAGETKKLETNAVWKWSEETPKSGENTVITVQIQDTDGKAIEAFDINHEKKLHLIAVSKDLSFLTTSIRSTKGMGNSKSRHRSLLVEIISYSPTIFLPAAPPQRSPNGLR